MSFHRIAALVLRQYYLLRGSPARIIPLFAWVAIDIALWGFITRYLNSVSNAGFNFIPVMLSAVLLWDFMSRIMQGITTPFLEDVWSHNFINLFASPLSVTEYLVGLVLSSVATSLVGLAVMVALATIVFGLSFLVYGSLLAIFLLVLFLFGISLGILGSALVLRFGPASQWFIWPIPALISPLACVFYPLSVLPRWMQALARLIPPSYVFEGMRGVLEHHAHSLASLAFASALSLFYLLLMVRTFAGVFRRAVRTGLLVRYSAETVS